MLKDLNSLLYNQMPQICNPDFRTNPCTSLVETGEAYGLWRLWIQTIWSANTECRGGSACFWQANLGTLTTVQEKQEPQHQRPERGITRKHVPKCMCLQHSILSHIHVAHHKVNFIKDLFTSKNSLYICWFEDSFYVSIKLSVFQAKLLAITQSLLS